jgi:hypothetical protein
MSKPDDPWSAEALKRRWRSATAELAAGDRMPFCRTGEGAQELVVFVTDVFARAVKRESLRSTPLLWTALKNLRYGYDPTRAMSPGGRDGIFHVSPDFKPKNAMVDKLYDGFRETTKGRTVLAPFLHAPESAQGIRVVSHGLRLLGFVEKVPAGYVLVLVDVDVNRR